MNTGNTFLKFKDKTGEEHLISIADVLHVGIPIDCTDDNGDDMKQMSDELFTENGGLLCHPLEY